MEFFATPFLGQPIGAWLLFLLIVLTLLALDLGVLHRKDAEIGVRQSLMLSAGYIGIASLFGAGVWWYAGSETGIAWYTAFFVEKSLSLDNVFVISMIFGYFAIPRLYQHRVLFWGIMGVIVLRAIMIGLGAAIVHSFSWMLYVFGAFLLITGIKMLLVKHEKSDMGDNAVLNWLRSHMRITPTLHGQKFVVTQADEHGKKLRYATPLLLALIMIELADLVFAVDSVPAVFAISTDPFVVYTSNIFAILGLRALYFALAAMVHRFAYLKYALALVLVFIGIKILLAELVFKIPALVSLGVTLGLIAGGVLWSLWKTRDNKPLLTQ